MENLRWIILALGLTIVLLIYLFGRKKDKSRQIDMPNIMAADELPSISTYEELLVDESVKIQDEFVASEINQFELDQALVEEVRASVDDALPDVMTDGAVLKSKAKKEAVVELDVDEPVLQDDLEEPVTAEEYSDDLIVMHVQANTAYFKGDDLLKVINQQQLKFADMKIYHAYDQSNDIIFSMSNMIQPGYFEPAALSDMRTPGVILFMQLSLVTDSEAAFERMMRCADALSQELDAKVTGSKQQLLTEQDIKDFRAKATYFK